MKTLRFGWLSFVSAATVGATTAFGGNVRDFGAKGDGVHDDTAAVQAAIDAGGLAFFPDGTYLCGTLYLKSDGGLDLSPGARILGTLDRTRYNRPDFCPQNYGAENPNKAHLICAVDKTNVVIRGGTIDGNASGFFAATKGKFTRAMMGGRKLKLNPPWHPAQMLFICECENVRLQDVNLVNSSFWNCMLYGCENVLVRGLRIKSDPQISGDDGLDIDCCRRVAVADCIIDVGDDGITLRGNGRGNLRRDRPCEWVTVNNCVIRSDYAHAIRVGVGSGTVRHCTFSNILMEDTRCAIHINSLYDNLCGGVNISDISFRDIRATSDILLFFALDYKYVGDKRFDGFIRDIRLDNVCGTTKLPIKMIGNGVGKLSNVLFTDSVVAFRPMDGLTDGDKRFFACDPADVGARVQTNGTENVVFRNVVFREAER